jgi:glutathione S-transferase
MVILHHYPQSPVSEKVRVVLGIKRLNWRSVEIPRLQPKPDLMPLTGGYRLTPVMQVGADIYCDSQCIIRELERRFSEPTLFPGGTAGMTWGLGRWTDGEFFHTVIALVFGAGAADLPPAFAADRGPLYFGSGFDLAALTKALPGTLAHLRAQLG